jgi:hypothetical protein
MKDEYDFSKAERGKLFRRDAQLIPPLHLDPEVLSYLAERAQARGSLVRRAPWSAPRSTIDQSGAGARRSSKRSDRRSRTSDA